MAAAALPAERRVSASESARTRRLLVPISSVWSVRNVLMTGLADRLAQSFDVVLAVPEGRTAGEDLLGRPVLSFPASGVGDRAYRHIRQRLGNAHLWHASARVAGAMARLRRRRKPLIDRFASRVTEWRARWEAHPQRYQQLVDRVETLDREMIEHGSTIEWLRAADCDAVLFATPETEVQRPLARAARCLGLHTIAMIHSFDNLTTKGRHPIRFDAYIVWSPDMKEELLRVYPEVDPGTVRVAGTTHFHFYTSSAHQITRAELMMSLGLEPSRPVVLYAAGPNALLPFEVPVIERLARDLAGALAPQRPQLVVRPHPLERDPERWKGLAGRVPEIAWSLPWEASATDPSWAIPTHRDLRGLCGIVRHSDVVVNAASTMSLDAAICDRPVVCVDYCLPPFEDFAPHLRRFYDYDHYRPITVSGAVAIARSPEELTAEIWRALREPERGRDERAALVRRMCGGAATDAVESVAEGIEESVVGERVLA